jgi:hypothetical protein
MIHAATNLFHSAIRFLLSTNYSWRTQQWSSNMTLMVLIGFFHKLAKQYFNNYCSDVAAREISSGLSGRIRLYKKITKHLSAKEECCLNTTYDLAIRLK